MKLKNPEEYPSTIFQEYPTGSVMQYEANGSHGIMVVVKSNERFVWLKDWDNRNNFDVKARRKLKKDLYFYGYSFQHCGYAGGEGAEYIGKIIDLEVDNKVTVKIFEVPSADIKLSGDSLTFEIKGHSYYLAYEADKTNQISVLWSDLKFLRKHYGKGDLDETSNITKASLNSSRLINIAEMKQAIKLGIHQRDLSQLNENGTFKMVRNHMYGKMVDGGVDNRMKIQYKPTKMTDELKAMYIKDMNRGLLVICKYV